MPLIPLAGWKVPRRAAAAQVSQSVLVPAPTGGLNYRDPIVAMQPQDALILENLIPRQTGVELRSGWQYHSTTTAATIRSIFAYNALSTANNKLFAGSSGKIYDLTSGTPTISLASASSTDIWSTTHFSTTAGLFLLAVSPGAGYYTYDPTGGWIARTPAGMPSNPTSVAVFKNRIWFTAQNSASLWYIDAVNALTGTAVEFPVGAQLKNGGVAQAIANWTLDAGAGIDDFMVVIGSMGDVIVYQGTDPTSASTFGLKGTWYVGPVPTQGRCFTPFGGDVMIVSEMGLVPLSRLVNGQFAQGAIGPADKIQSVLSPLVRDLRTTAAWDIFMVPDENILVIKPPQDTTGAYTQYAMNVTTGAWCTFDGIPMTSATLLGDQLYCGTSDGRSFKAFYGTRDGVAIAGTGGSNIEGDLQTAFNSFGNAALLKKFNLAHPIFIAPQQPSLKLQMNTQFTFQGVPGSPSFTASSGSLWSSGVWSVARWAGGSNTYEAWVGMTGLGYYGSLRLKILGVPNTLFTGSQLMLEIGGVM